ncbi:hypothetical protein I3843_07G210100 [Carya illinoinensis]|uniref:Protein FAM32A-like n=1 Tax=Carya illinoinensis TaxID=32201 RepID=A0A8T1PY46_CARIL|nr:protein FAM32A-like [Carya illinoinensis]XP_042986958.1 protein FAM32A-like [Carya illinoinensis]KAG2699915.1 hypothetical protein I3760_07G210700 [Carya illinoinensis]KAG2699916.1 hypothetical protein I3760_07G210700 [Carya illinoinensis]KAG6649469.1 hypothetical protein CIPAW_07G214500 [Carya illinoinensis]KAG6649470.1 hypothetical protein CIPAW_07G214500 [Carya illinoinensis]KAG6706286.1 hypothetical protein I3842_07G216800 [Carya illinoinensis]
MSVYENVVFGKLKLKGKALDVKAGGIQKKKKREKHSDRFYKAATIGLSSDLRREEDMDETAKDGGRVQAAAYDDHLTPAERRYLHQREKIELQMLAKMATKSHRDRIQEFNQYLANLSEHYDIPKVGPG